MQIGLIGAGNMARALARGWGRPVLCADPLAARAQALAAETGGEALGSNEAVAERADLIVLCHKPAQLKEVAQTVAPHAKAVASILAATPLASLKAVYPDRPVFRFMPSLPVEVRQGAVVQAADGEQDPALDAAVHAPLFAELGTLVTLDDALVDVAMGMMSCGPAYVALVAEAQVDAGVRRGIPAAQGAALVTQTLAGTAELLRRRDYDTLAVRREVSSPGGLTARGIDALERGGVRAAFSEAMDAVLRPAPCALASIGLIGARVPVSASVPVGAGVLASARVQIADYLSTLIYVYTLLIIVYIVLNLLFAVGLRPPYSRTSDAILAFLRDICEPFLRLFRRIIPMMGAFDFSPILAIITLEIINSVVVQGLIHG